MYASVTNGMGPRMERVERLLKLLDQLDVGEPPADLTRRTLDRIHELEDRVDSPMRTPAQSQIHPQA